MRIGQALGLRHEDVVAWERRIVIRAARGRAAAGAQQGRRARAAVPVPGELMRLWTDYMHEEYGDLDCDFVFVNLWGGRGRAAADLLERSTGSCARTQQSRSAFTSRAHQLRHTYATLAYRDGVRLR